MQNNVTATKDGLGYWVTLGSLRSFVSSLHLVPDKEAQLQRINQEANQ